ncbi:MAG: restriction endonuclease subunit S [Desulfatirhabdiaceae bacterium]
MNNNRWQTFKIGELGRVVTGKTPSTQDDKNFGSKYPFITPRDMTGQKKIDKTERYLSEQGKLAVKNCLLPPEAVCVSCIGSDMGKVVMTTQDSVTNQQLNSIICSASFNPDFVYYSITNISDVLRNTAHHSTAVPILNKAAFSNFEIEVPDLSTQTSIAAILSALDDKIELNRQTNATLEAIAQAIFKEWFVDFRFPGATGEMQESELGLVPMGWRVGKLGEILGFKNGKSSPERDDTYEYPVYGANGMIGFANSYNSTDKNIVIGRVGSFCGSVHLPLTKIWVTDNSIMAEPKIENTTIFCFIQLQRIQLNTYKTGSGQPLLNQNILSNIEILIPPIDVICDYEKVAFKLFEQIVFNNQLSVAISKTRDTILPKLMSGEIEV